MDKENESGKSDPWMRYISIAGITLSSMFFLIASYYLQIQVNDLYKPLVLMLFISSAYGMAVSIIVLIKSTRLRKRSRSSDELNRLLDLKEKGILSEEEFVQKVKQPLIFTKRRD